MRLHELIFGIEISVHVPAHLDEGDGLHACADGDRRAVRLDVVRSDRDGVEAGRAEAPNLHARRGDRAAGVKCGVSSDIMPGRPFGVAAAQDHVLDFSGVNTRACDGVLDRMTGHCRAVSVVEAASDGFGEPGAGIGDDDGFAHVVRALVWRSKTPSTL